MSVVVVIVAVGAALLTAAGAAVAVARARMGADERVAEAVRRLADGMHDTMRELAGAVESARDVPRGGHFATELSASLDLDEVARRTIEAAASIAGVDAVLLDASGPRGDGVSAAFELPAEEAARTAVSLPENDNLRAIEVTYRYRIDDVDASAPVVRSGVVLPVRADGMAVGTLSAFTRTAGRPLGDDEIEHLERLAFRAGPALDNARRFAEARALADLDALTGLHNHRYFHEMLGREVARALRYSRRLSLIVLDLDDFKAVNDRVGHLQGDAVLAEVAGRIRMVVRSADLACRVGGDEFAVLLPESARSDAELLAGRIARAVRGQAIGQAGTLNLSAGIAELRPNEDAQSLFERADEALYRAKELGKARTVAANDA
ncbi:MAG TPA: sensor domain-containing diguanylate cyclase [Gaiellaceae bacterium]|nr:sensor domain-containing diguanylate cyclase [Gaiellaceae bacterium]